jgi:2-haloacid dehalogenase
VAALPLIVFDVNETLLDLQTMEPIFERIFGERQAMRLWFANFIMYSAALTVAGHYVPFTDIGSAVMKMLADTQGIKIGDADKKELTEQFSTMPPHREVPAALRKLRDAGFRLFTLTDNLLEVQTRQLEHGGIAGCFERRFSADGVKHHKPARQAYAYVERELGVEPAQLCLIACHTWDTLGAVAAGWEAALIKAGRQRCFGGRPSAADRRRQPERRRRSADRAAPGAGGGLMAMAAALDPFRSAIRRTG